MATSKDPSGALVGDGQDLRRWWRAGHRFIAAIAYQNLTPGVKREADRLITVMADLPPRFSDFVGASIWMDELHNHGLELFRHWHYIHLPYNPDDLPNVPDPPRENVVWCIEQSRATLQEASSTDFARALALRILIHIIADIHQPFHAINRYSRDFPKGDRGGNDFHLDSEFRSLHILWDAGGGVFEELDASSLPAEEPAAPPSELGSAMDWARESHRLARDAYRGIARNTRPSPEYLEMVRRVSLSRASLGGRRLATTLNKDLRTVPNPGCDPI